VFGWNGARHEGCVWFSMALDCDENDVAEGSMMRMRKSIIVTLTLLCAVGCANPSPAEKPKENFQYWSSKPGYVCATMAGRDYCFEERLIMAQSLQTDDRPGFLLNVPVSDPEVVDCNKRDYLLRSDQLDRFPNVVVMFGEQKGGGSDPKTGEIWVDSTEKYFDRMYQKFYGTLDRELNDVVIFPHQPITYYGLNCVKTKPDAMLQEEAYCQVGKYGDLPPPHFFSCKRDGSVPNPGCDNTMFYRDMRFKISFNKKCGPHHALIRQRVVEFLDRMEVTRGNK
jgi:hypothetical protein